MKEWLYKKILICKGIHIVKMRIIPILVCFMCLYLPHSFAFSWQEDIDANTQELYKIYEVYQYMPIDDYHNAWDSVPGWTKVIDHGSRNGIYDVYRKNGVTNDGVIEEFTVSYYNNEVSSGPSLIFRTTDKKIADRITNYIVAKMNKLTGQYKSIYDHRSHQRVSGISWKVKGEDGRFTYMGTWTGHDKKTGQYDVFMWKEKDLIDD